MYLYDFVILRITLFCIYRVASWGGGPTPLKFQSVDKAEPNSQFHEKYICNNLIRIQVSLVYILSETPD
jgi:hypothetical protein